MISDASVLVSCDGGCGHEEERYLTALVGEAWDARTLRKGLERDGWEFLDQDHLICPSCAEARS